MKLCVHLCPIQKGLNAYIHFTFHCLSSILQIMMANREEVRLYLAEAHQMLQAAADTLALGHLSTSVNRSYYAVFYAASALLQSVDQTRAKHHGVFSAFGQHFVKSGL